MLVFTCILLAFYLQLISKLPILSSDLHFESIVLTNTTFCLLSDTLRALAIVSVYYDLLIGYALVLLAVNISRRSGFITETIRSYGETQAESNELERFKQRQRQSQGNYPDVFVVVTNYTLISFLSSLRRKLPIFPRFRGGTLNSRVSPEFQRRRMTTV